MILNQFYVFVGHLFENVQNYFMRLLIIIIRILYQTFISVAGIELLQQKNQFGETVLLHAARLNRVDIVKALLERKNSDKLLEDTNDKKQNIFHILALNTDSDKYSIYSSIIFSKTPSIFREIRSY